MSQGFITEKKSYIIGQLKSWTITILFAFILYYSLNLLMKVSSDRSITAVIAFLLLRAGDTLTQYHVSGITIDNQNKQLILILKSLMSGQKTKVYDLSQINTSLQKNAGLRIISNSSVILNLYMNSRDRFRISSRYGFSEETLSKIDSEVKRSQA